jgi:thiol-disulfide isomerase/thioredoxin
LGLERILQAPPGTEVSWEKLKGNVVVLEFWATWCGPCLRALPHVNAMVERFRDRPVRFISVTSEPETVVADCLKRYRLRGWVGLDTDRSMFESYGVDEIPYTVVVDSDGIVVRVTRPTDLTAETLERLLTKNGR